MPKKQKTEKTVTVATLREILRDADIEALKAFNEAMEAAQGLAKLTVPAEREKAFQAFGKLAEAWTAAESKAKVAESVYLQAKVKAK